MSKASIGEPPARKIHPFFTKSDALAPVEDSSTTQFAAPPPITTGSEASAPESASEEPRPKRRKTDTPVQDGSEPKRRRRQRRSANSSLTGAILNHLTKPKEVSAVSEAAQEIPSPPLSDKPDDEREAAGNAKSDASANIPSTAIPAQPKRLLKFDPRTGTLGSPPKPKPQSKPSRIVCVSFGKDVEDQKRIGDKISKILDGTLQLPPDVIEQSQKGKPKDKASVLKTTHPLFSQGKLEAAKPDPDQKPAPARHSIFVSTPMSHVKPKNAPPLGKAAQFGTRSFGTKIPGAMYPLWPTRGMSHIRGDSHRRSSTLRVSSPTRKSKGLVTTVPPSESVIRYLTDGINLPLIRKSLRRDPDSFDPAPAELRLPQRHFESGRKLRDRIRSQVQTRFIDTSLYEDCDFGPDELLGRQASRAHAALSWLYKSLETQLSAFDRSCCENLAWVQKYAPTTSAQILQKGQEALLIRDWLQTLRVQSVESGGSDDRDKEKVDGAKKKRKKNKVDDFILESEEEMDSMEEISDEEDEWDPRMGPRRKSVVRSGASGKTPGRLANAIIISGPHGCGKTAAVYAVAKELDFEVFEINSSSRRGGKDVLERVGDMTRNHLVQHNRAEATTDADEATMSDIHSGKQGMMTAFFKPKEAPAKKRGRKKKEAEPVEKRAKAAAQKQSLILLEEVDVLFEEDKQFWASLMGLIAQSKRPFVMTCNDESLVPVQSLHLHGIFRFSAVPAHLAVDLCILTAANEGHALQRPAVEALYHSRNDDLRATLTELNYWCQLGVGDRRGGFDWFYLRWPRGSDVDEEGDVVRVVSEATYRRGMGWLGREAALGAEEEEVLRQGWEHWQHDLGDWSKALDMDAWAAREARTRASSTARLASLTAYETFCDTMSDADVCSSGAYATDLEQAVDTTHPQIPLGARDDYIIGQTLLDARPVERQTPYDVAIPACLRSLARETLRLSTGLAKGDEDKGKGRRKLRRLDEAGVTSVLERCFRMAREEERLRRYDIALAFDAIAVHPRAAPTSHLDASVFDRPLEPIVVDVAPWVRGIVAHEERLMRERLRMSGGGGGGRKRMRQTRSALSAMEGGERGMMREKHFGDCLVTRWVMRTGGSGWGVVEET